MKTRLFSLIILISPNLFSFYDENLILMINEVDTQGVQILLKQSQMTPEEKMKLLTAASSSIANCTLQQKTLQNKAYDAMPGERFGVILASLGTLGFIASPVVLFTAGLAAGFSSAVVTGAIFSPGFWLVYSAQKKRAKDVEEREKEYQQKFIDAHKIKRLILLAR